MRRPVKMSAGTMRRGYRDDQRTGAFDGERVFRGEVDLRYAFEPAASRTLVVAFSSAPAAGEPPRYRWHRLLRRFPCNRLFVLDDRGPQPSWYLGAGGRLDVADSVCALVDSLIAELAVDRTVAIGSSMGGWAALYFAARCGLGHAIAGEPQTLLGRYLCGPAFHAVAEQIAGGCGPEHSEFLDGVLFDALRARHGTHVHLLCGRGSPYRAGHVRPLVALLDELGSKWDLELADYDDHDDLRLHFPPYLERQLSELIA